MAICAFLKISSPLPCPTPTVHDKAKSSIFVSIFVFSRVLMIFITNALSYSSVILENKNANSSDTTRKSCEVSVFC